MAKNEKNNLSAGTLMVQGTGSHVGKSFMVAGLCRLFKNEGLAVAPFKSQNMALNSFATESGLEMGRAQAVQAMAAGIKPQVGMNPILLKPTSDRLAQVIVNGVPVGSMSASEFHARKLSMMETVKDSLRTLRNAYDLVIIEGAGSPAEVNLADRDIANMAVADAAGAPVLLVADIDRGGAFASLCGTLELLAEKHRRRVQGFIINKFRGDIDLLRSGLDFLEQKTGTPVIGVVPYADIRLEAEDSVGLEVPVSGTGAIRIAVPLLPRISNFTDLLPLELEPDAQVCYVRRPEEIERADAVIIPGSKNTLADLRWLRQTGLAESIVGLARSKTPVIGICGGFQMLGLEISDPLGVEGQPGSQAEGLKLLPVVSRLSAEKLVSQAVGEVAGGGRVVGADALGTKVSGYEIHCGLSTPQGPGGPFARIAGGRDDGWVSDCLPVIGTYLHGMFESERLRRSFLGVLAERKGVRLSAASDNGFEVRIEKVATLLRESLDIELLSAIIARSAAGEEVAYA